MVDKSLQEIEAILLVFGVQIAVILCWFHVLQVKTSFDFLGLNVSIYLNCFVLLTDSSLVICKINIIYAI